LNMNFRGCWVAGEKKVEGDAGVAPVPCLKF
jgi:hypothetical protein